MGADGERAAGRFARGCRCFAIENHGEIVTFGWLSTRREWIGELNLWITPSDAEGYIWNCFTLDPHRRLGNYRRLLEGFVSLPGFSRLWIGSVEDPAEKADADAGFVAAVSLEAWQFAGFRWLRVRPEPGDDPALATTARRRLGLATLVTFGRTRRLIH